MNKNADVKDVDLIYTCLSSDLSGTKCKFIPLGSCRLKPGGKTLDEILKDKDDKIAGLQRQINTIVTKLGLTAELAVLTAESRGND